MKTRWMLCLFAICLFAVPAMAQTANEESQKQAELSKQLIAEVKSLRRELLQQGIEFQHWKLRQIERELLQARTEADRMESDVRAMEQELAALLSETGKETESFKEKTLRQLQRLQSRQQPLRDRIVELSSEQNREDARLRQLSAK